MGSKKKKNKVVKKKMGSKKKKKFCKHITYLFKDNNKHKH
jgi:hypothetical protein